MSNLNTPALFRLVDTVNGGKTVVRTDRPSLLLYAADVRKHTPVDPLCETYHAVVSGCFTAGLEPMTCGMVLDGMLKNEIEYLDGLMAGRRNARQVAITT